MFNGIKKLARKFGLAEIHIKDFTPESHSAYFEYFIDDTGRWLARFYDHDTNKVIKETTGRAADGAAARKQAQSSIRRMMRTLKRAR
jgi:hypothetical protein